MAGKDAIVAGNRRKRERHDLTRLDDGNEHIGSFLRCPRQGAVGRVTAHHLRRHADRSIRLPIGCRRPRNDTNGQIAGCRLHNDVVEEDICRIRSLSSHDVMLDGLVACWIGVDKPVGDFKDRLGRHRYNCASRQRQVETSAARSGLKDATPCEQLALQLVDVSLDPSQSIFAISSGTSVQKTLAHTLSSANLVQDVGDHDVTLNHCRTRQGCIDHVERGSDFIHRLKCPVPSRFSAWLTALPEPSP